MKSLEDLRTRIQPEIYDKMTSYIRNELAANLKVEFGKVPELTSADKKSLKLKEKLDRIVSTSRVVNMNTSDFRERIGLLLSYFLEEFYQYYLKYLSLKIENDETDIKKKKKKLVISKKTKDLSLEELVEKLDELVEIISILQLVKPLFAGKKKQIVEFKKYVEKSKPLN